MLERRRVAPARAGSARAEAGLLRLSFGSLAMAVARPCRARLTNPGPFIKGRRLGGLVAAMFLACAPVFFERGRTFRGEAHGEDETGQDPKSPEDARLTSLDERLKQAQLEEAARKGRPDIERSQQLVRSVGMRMLYRPGRASVRRRPDRLAARPVVRDRAVDNAGDAVPRVRPRRQECHASC